jgi:hypothetical protein
MSVSEYISKALKSPAALMPLQTRLPYGFEYNGAPVEGVPFVLPACNPGLTAAVNALQTSPVVTLTLAGTQVLGGHSLGVADDCRKPVTRPRPEHCASTLTCVVMLCRALEGSRQLHLQHLLASTVCLLS